MKPLPMIVAGALLVAACAAPEPPPRTVQEFVDDPTLLQGVVARCSPHRARDGSDVECANAFAAVERLAQLEEDRRAADRAAAFERQRERRRLLDEQQRADAERSAPKFDPYSSPVDGAPTAPSPAAPAGTSPPAVGAATDVAAP
jgi:hypothetical protein